MAEERKTMDLEGLSAPALGVEERSDGAPSAGANAAPDAEVVAKPKRRRFTAEYRLRILEEADRENSALAGRLIEETCNKQGVQPEMLTLHSDRGSPMTSKCTAQLLADLGVTRSLSRPQVSDDNPFSEAQFKTLKYHPGFPSRFLGSEHATSYCRSFFPWYNTEHRHGGIAMLTPHDVHYGRAPAILAQRQLTLEAAWAAHPERFVRGIPKTRPLPEEVWINPPVPSTTGGIAP